MNVPTPMVEAFLQTVPVCPAMVNAIKARAQEEIGRTDVLPITREVLGDPGLVAGFLNWSRGQGLSA